MLNLSINETINLLNRYELTPNELLFMRILLIYQHEQYEQELFYNFANSLIRAGVAIRELLVSLQNKHILSNDYIIPPKGTVLNPDNIIVNKQFIDTFQRCSYELGNELYETYPDFTIINNETVSIKTVAKHYDSLEQAYFKYCKAINWSIDLHKKILELVQWGKDNNLICCSLSSFIINRGWNTLEKFRDKVDGDYSNMKLI